MAANMDTILALDAPPAAPRGLGVVEFFAIDGGCIAQCGALAFWWLDAAAPATPERARHLAYCGVPHVVSADADDLLRLVLERFGYA